MLRILEIISLVLISACSDGPKVQARFIYDISQRQVILIDNVKMDKTRYLVQKINTDSGEKSVRVYGSDNDYNKHYVMLNDNGILIEISKQEHDALLSK